MSGYLLARLLRFTSAVCVQLGCNSLKSASVGESEVTTDALLSDDLCIWPSVMASRPAAGNGCAAGSRD